jgi:4-hydroxy-tetrahydrodipicolinate reductase
MSPSTDKISIGILGAQGKMGQLISKLISDEFSSQALMGSRVGRNDPFDSLLKEDVIIDVANPSAMSQLAKFALTRPEPLPPFVVGSTGWSHEEVRSLHALAERTPVLIAPNFSAGVFVLSEILKNYSFIFRKLGYAPVIVETHHRHKKDSPSGTALLLQNSILPQSSASSEKVQTHSIRAGEVVGTHDVTFYGSADAITLKHFAQDRSIFARGAIEVALWLTREANQKKQERGILGMNHYFESLKGAE